jgi:hypothetical protein
MVRISDIIGALMRGITTARIQSDIHSAQASHAYLNDPNLKSYPVPRTEIRQADVNFKVSILDTVQRNVDANQLALQTLIGALPEYVAIILTIPVRPTATSPSSEAKPLATYLGAQTAAVTDAIIAQLEAYLTLNIAAAWLEMSGSPRKYGTTTWKTQTISVVSSVLTTYQITAYVQGTDFSRPVSTAAAAWCEEVTPEAQLAIDLAITAFFDLDIAIKKDDLFSLPAHVMSELRLTFVIENYEWVTVRDAQGNIINKLTKV